MLISRKFSECMLSSNSTVYFIAGSCLFSILKTHLRKTSFENVRGCHLQSVGMFLGQFFNLRLPLWFYIEFSGNNILKALP